MAFEGIVLKRVADHALSRLSGGLISHQSPFNSSGPLLYPQPTVLEPYFISVDEIDDVRGFIGKPADIIYESPDKQCQLCRYTVLPSTSYEHRWDKADLLLRHLPALYNRCGFEIVGNSKEVKFRFLCEQSDFPVLSTAFSAKFLDCALREDCPEFFDRHYELLKFRDYNAPGLHSHLLTQPAAFKSSAYETLLFVLSTLPKETMGFAQVLFKACSPENNWHKLVKVLTDAEYTHNMMQTPGLAGRYPQQMPSEDLRGTSLDVDTKSHPDKPFFGAAVRIGVCGEDDSYCRRKLECMCSCNNLFRHSGRALEYISDEQYGDIDTYQMFEQGLVYRPGLLVNSTELAGWVHIPPIELFNQTSCKLETLSPQFRNPMGVVTMDISKGTLIGYRQADHSREAVVIPDDIRRTHLYIVGKTKRGKSTVIGNAILDNALRGQGSTIIDPHGDLIEELLDRIPEKMVKKTIVFDPGLDNNQIPLYNPLAFDLGTDLSVAAGNMVSILKSVFPIGWGMRLEHILYYLLFSAMNVRGMSFLEVKELLRRGKNSKQILDKITNVVADGETLNFLNGEFKNYRSDELQVAIHRLSPLLHSETMSLAMFQPENRFDFKKIIDDGMLFLVNLASLGREQKISLGGFIINSIHCTALRRLNIPEHQRRLYHLYIDEAHLFNIEVLDKMMVEGRKCYISFNLAHQYLSQFPKERVDALLNSDTVIAFCLGYDDAAVMKKNFMNKPTEGDFMELGVGEAMLRVDTDIAKITTLNRADVTKSYREQIMRNSHQRYYKPAQQIRRNNRFRFKGCHEPFATVLPEELVRSDGVLETDEYDIYE